MISIHPWKGETYINVFNVLFVLCQESEKQVENEEERLRREEEMKAAKEEEERRKQEEEEERIRLEEEKKRRMEEEERKRCEEEERLKKEDPRFWPGAIVYVSKSETFKFTQLGCQAVLLKVVKICNILPFPCTHLSRSCFVNIPGFVQCHEPSNRSLMKTALSLVY